MAAAAAIAASAAALGGRRPTFHIPGRRSEGVSNGVTRPTETLEGLSEKARAEKTRVDSNVFRGLREEMKRDAEEGKVSMMQHIEALSQHFISFAIVLNALQMGATIQFGDDAMGIWNEVANHFFTGVFFVELCVKLFFMKMAYFDNSWNTMDGFLSVLSVFSNWLFPMLNIQLPLSFITVLRLFRLLRLTRLLHVRQELVILVESLFRSINSLGWILVLLCIIVYTFSILSCSVIDPHLYAEEEDFDVFLYFGSASRAFLTLFNMCLLAEWPEIVRPVVNHQPHVFLFVFVPYLMLCTLGVLNLIIGVIAEQTLLAGQEQKQEKEDRSLREKMKDILRLTDNIFEGKASAQLTCPEFEEAAIRNPDFIDIMKTCEFPRGFQVAHLFQTFNESSDGNLKPDELVNGMFRLVFNTLQQHACTILLNTAQVKTEFKKVIEQLVREELRDIKDLVQGHGGMVDRLKEIKLEEAALADQLPSLQVDRASTNGPASAEKKVPTVVEDIVQQLRQDIKVDLATLEQNVSMAVVQAFDAQLSARRLQSARAALPLPPNSDTNESVCRNLKISHELLKADLDRIVSAFDQPENPPWVHYVPGQPEASLTGVQRVSAGRTTLLGSSSGAIPDAASRSFPPPGARWQPGRGQAILDQHQGRHLQLGHYVPPYAPNIRSPSDHESRSSSRERHQSHNSSQGRGSPDGRAANTFCVGSVGARSRC